MIRIIFPNGFPVPPSGSYGHVLPCGLSCSGSARLRFAWNDGNKKIDFLNDIYPS